MPTQGGSREHRGSIWPHWHENWPFALVLLLIGAFTVVYLMARIDQIQAETREVGPEHTITIEGTGKAIGKPDVATITVGVDTKGVDAASAQTKNTETVNGLTEKIKAAGVNPDDIQTSSYNVYENTVWDPDSQTYKSNGWIVSQSLTIKVRDTSKVSTLLTVAGQNGATNVYGPSFTIDDPSDLKAEARALAVADAREKAMKLAATLGVKIDTVVGYSEYDGGVVYPFDGYGGEARSMSSDSAVPPTIEPGTNEVQLTVSITYRLAD